MAKLAKLLVGMVLLLYVGMCFLSKFDGGASRGMPSASLEEARRSGMLVKPVVVIRDSGAPAGVSEGWIEIAAGTHYLLGAFPKRVPLRYYLENGDSVVYLLSIPVPAGVSLDAGKSRSLRNGGTVEAYELTPPLPDTVHIRRLPPPGSSSVAVILQDGRLAKDAAPRR